MNNYFGEVNPVLLLTMIVGITEFAKKLGVQGNWTLVVSALLGVILGVLYQAAQVYTGMVPIFNIVVYGVLFGLTASGLIDAGRKFIAFGVSKYADAVRKE